MPCKSDHMKPHAREVEYSRVLSLLDELDGKGAPSDRQWRGYDSRAYCAGISQKDLDSATATLCRRLKSLDDVTKFSLEMQLWWREHKKKDAEREEFERYAEEKERLRLSGLNKLTIEERHALGLPDNE